jgi:2-keto-4-pentenoate hydratase
MHANNKIGGSVNGVTDNVRAVAERFVRARKAATSLAGYPGEAMGDLAAAYACQELAITLWPDRVIGWKIGRIQAPDDISLGADRLAGPIFARSVMLPEPGEATSFPVILGGFAAVEAEFVFHIGETAPPGKLHWTLDEAAALVVDVSIGVEIAGSPLATINDLGPLVVASDFGNNMGLILGHQAKGWRDRPLKDWTCETWIDGELVGQGGVNDLPGGPFEAVRFIAELCAARGRPLRVGDLVSTGAVTGVHDIKAGQTARLHFDGFGALDCVAIRAEPI